MKNNNLIRFAQSLILLPFMTMPLTINGISGVNTQDVLVQKFNIEAPGTYGPYGKYGAYETYEKYAKLAFNQATEPEADKANAEALKAKAEAVDAYFRERGMPLEGFGMNMVVEAEKNGLDWRLIAAIAVRESTGGKFACKGATFNSFGWGSCKIDFQSNEKAIETVARNLGGNNPNTARYYDDKTTIEILRAYNPPSIVPKYAEQVISIMDIIGTEDTTAILAKVTT